MRPQSTLCCYLMLLLTPPVVADDDPRVVVELPQRMQVHMRANMRDHLSAIQEIPARLAQGQYEEAAAIAEGRLGMTALESHGAHHVARFMPQGMRDAGTAMHRAASRFAVRAAEAAVTDDLRAALEALSQVTAQCVACHAGYRLP